MRGVTIGRLATSYHCISKCSAFLLAKYVKRPRCNVVVFMLGLVSSEDLYAHSKLSSVAGPGWKLKYPETERSDPQGHRHSHL